MVLDNVLTLQMGWLEIGFTLFLLLIYWYYSWTYAYTYWKRHNAPYLTPKFPFGNFADVILFKKTFRDSWLDIYNQIGDHPFCGIYAVKTPMLVVKDPELIKTLLTKDFNHFTDHGWVETAQHEPLLNNLFFMNGEVWKKFRYQVSPAFSSGKMKMMFPIINECARQFKLSLERYSKNSGTLDAKDLMSRFTMDIILNAVFGINSYAVNDPNCDLFNKGRKIFRRSLKQMFSNLMVVLSPKMYRFLKLHFLEYEHVQYFADLVKGTIERRERNHITKNDFVDILVRLKNNLSIDDADMHSDSPVAIDNGEKKKKKKTAPGITVNELMAQALTFIFAGLEPSASAMSFSLYELSRRPDLQLKIQNEVDAALERHGGAMTYQMMNELPYLDRVINETLRRYNTLSTVDRVCTKSYRIPDTDIVVEKGCKVCIPTYAVHHDPHYYPDPFVFDPDRFLEENGQTRPAFTFMPFGDGPRMCIGWRFARMQMRLGLATFFSQFSCKLNPSTPVPLTIARWDLLTKTKDNIVIEIIPRNST